MFLHFLRGLFVAAVIAVIWSVMSELDAEQSLTGISRYLDAILLGSVGLCLLIIAADILSPRKNLMLFSGALLGVVGGVVIAYGLGLVIDLTVEGISPDLLRRPVYAVVRPPILLSDGRPATDRNNRPIYGEGRVEQVGTKAHPAITGAKLVLGIIAVYLCVSFVLQTKDDIRFVIPYVEFAKEQRGVRPLVLDSSVLIDGRIVDLAETNLLDAPLLIPRFVVGELQLLADNPDKLRRARGRRGLDLIAKLQGMPQAQVEIHDPRPPLDNSAEGVDGKLLTLTKRLAGRLVTNDLNLCKVAAVRGVSTINLNQLAAAMKTVVLVGETLTVKPVKPGENPGQAVAYLEDGTMVVCENGRDKIGQEIHLTVTSVIQTSAGKLIFGKPMA